MWVSVREGDDADEAMREGEREDKCGGSILV